MKSPDLKKPQGCIPATSRNHTILGKGQETWLFHPSRALMTNPYGLEHHHDPCWAPGSGCATPPAPTSKQILAAAHVYWLHGKKILNKENKPCVSNPGAVSPARVSNAFSTPIPSIPSAPSLSSVTPCPSPLSQGWDGEAGIASRGWKSPFCLFTGARSCQDPSRREFCRRPRVSWGEADRGRGVVFAGGHLIPATCQGG